MEENTGKFLWIDLTVPEAENIRDFYSAVVGWNWETVAVEDYHDYNIKTPDGRTGGRYLPPAGSKCKPSACLDQLRDCKQCFREYESLHRQWRQDC